MKKLLKLLSSIFIVTLLLLSAGVAVYSAATGQSKNLLATLSGKEAVKNAEAEKNTKIEADTKVVPGLIDKEPKSTALPGETKEVIRLSGSVKSEANTDNYTELLESLHVHEKYKNEMDRLLGEGHSLSDILTAYSFLNDKYGKLQEIETLVQKKESGKDWADIFIEYNKKNPEFVPRSFDDGYLEELLKVPGITADDIMIADRVSQKTGRTYQEVMEKRMEGKPWKDINAGLDIVNGDETLLRVSVSPEQIDKYVNTGMDRDLVVKGYVIAKKLGQKADTVMKELKEGTKEEELLDKYYTQKYY